MLRGGEQTLADYYTSPTGERRVGVTDGCFAREQSHVAKSVVPLLSSDILSTTNSHLLVPSFYVPVDISARDWENPV